jgi:ABC-2 type transport system ATP-binding protein
MSELGPQTRAVDGPPAGAGPALALRGLTKAFGELVAVDRLDLDVGRGWFFGLVGPNGAGKTTALTMAVGLRRPDAGSAQVLGADVWREPDRAKALLGVLPDGLSLPTRLTGRELLTYLGRLRGMPAEVVEARTDELLDVLGLEGAGRTLVADYSTGMRKKAGLATALLHGPRVLVLDEPFEAVDPVSAATVRTILERFVEGGGTVVMSSHVMPLVERLCDHVAVMHRGRILAAGTVDELRGDRTLDEAFVDLVGATGAERGLSWLGS